VRSERLDPLPVPDMPRGRRWHRDTKAEWASWYEAGVPALWSPAQHVQARQLLGSVDDMHRAASEKERRIIGRQVRLERNDLGLRGEGKPEKQENTKDDPFGALKERNRRIRRERREQEPDPMDGLVSRPGEPEWMTIARHELAALEA
jgi:hypothetical protein